MYNNEWEIKECIKKKSHLGHGCLSVVGVVYCQVGISATS